MTHSGSFCWQEFARNEMKKHSHSALLEHVNRKITVMNISSDKKTDRPFYPPSKKSEFFSHQKGRHFGTLRPEKKRFRWHDGNGRQLTAGGILPYDDSGIWVVGEMKKNGDIEYTDPGGKYKFEDCDIYTTCSREFGEELYQSSTISREAVINIASTHQPVYVNGHRNCPVYICYVVHVDTLKNYGVDLSCSLFDAARQQTIISNPDVPKEYYNSVVLKHIIFSDLVSPMKLSDSRGEPQFEDVRLSYRLKRILKYGPLSDKIDFRSISPEKSTTCLEELKIGDYIETPNTSNICPSVEDRSAIIVENQ